MARTRLSAASKAASATTAPWAWAVVGAVVGFLMGLFFFAPASWLASAVAQASGQQVQLVGARGTLWQGDSQLVLTGGIGSAQALALPGKVHWSLRPTWQGLHLALKADCCTPQPLQAQVSAMGLSGVRVLVQDSQSQWSAGLLAGLGTPWNTIAPQGQLHISSHALGLELDRNGRTVLLGRMQVDALQIASRLSTLTSMGSYRVTVQAGDTVGTPTSSDPTLQLSTLDGSALHLAGQGQWIGARLRFNGTASAAPESVEALSNLLNIVGRRDGARSLITVG